jgi:hypothetical protein
MRRGLLMSTTPPRRQVVLGTERQPHRLPLLVPCLAAVLAGLFLFFPPAVVDGTATSVVSPIGVDRAAGDPIPAAPEADDNDDIGGSERRYFGHGDNAFDAALQRQLSAPVQRASFLSRPRAPPAQL